MVKVTCGTHIPTHIFLKPPLSFPFQVNVRPVFVNATGTQVFSFGEMVKLLLNAYFVLFHY